MVLSSVLFFALCACLPACTTPRLDIQSKPDGADVYAVRDNQAPIKLGATPLNLTKDSNPDLFTDGVEIKVSKDGYTTQSVLLPKSVFGTEARLSLNLQENKLPASCTEADQIMNELARGVAEAQNLIFKRNYDQAQQNLATMITKYPGVAALYALLGNIAYLQKDLTTALSEYRRAQQLQPENVETSRMIDRINRIRGSGTGGAQ